MSFVCHTKRPHSISTNRLLRWRFFPSIFLDCSAAEGRLPISECGSGVPRQKTKKLWGFIEEDVLCCTREAHPLVGFRNLASWLRSSRALRTGLGGGFCRMTVVLAYDFGYLLAEQCGVYRAILYADKVIFLHRCRSRKYFFPSFFVSPFCGSTLSSLSPPE